MLLNITFLVARCFKTQIISIHSFIWAGLPASSGSPVTFKSHEWTVINCLWPHLISDDFQEKCLWLDSIMRGQPSIKVYRACQRELRVCMWGRGCVRTRTHAHTYVGTSPALSSSHSFPLFIREWRDPSLPVLFSQPGVTGSITGPSIPPSFTITRPYLQVGGLAESRLCHHNDFLFACRFRSNIVSEGRKPSPVLLSHFRFT